MSRQDTYARNKEELFIKAGAMIQHHRDSLDIFKAYEINEGDVLGEGGFGKVVKGKRKGHDDVRAIKIIDLEMMEEEELVRTKYEIEILRNLTHPNIVRLYEVFEDKNKMYLVQELI